MAKLVFGCGYLGSRVARLWRQAGEQVFVVTRRSQRATELAAQGYQPIVADVMRPDSLAQLPAADAVLFAIGHDRQSGDSLRDVYQRGLAHVLAALPAESGKFLYVSSTGVYAQSQGEWIDEESPCQPVREAGQACLAAEQALLAHPIGRRSIILRMAGLYGPGRVPNLSQIQSGQPLAVPQAGYLNLIHIDDAANVVVAAAQRASPPRTYVVSDGQPVERRAYYQELARLVGVAAVQFAEPAGDSAAARRAAASKRVRNARMLAELDVRLQYADYRQGLDAIVAAENEQ